MSKKLDKDVLKSPDMFVSTSDRIFNFIERHFKVVAGVLVAAIVIAVGAVTMNYLNSRKEYKAAEALYAPEAALKKAEMNLREQRAKSSAKDKKAVVEATGDYVKDYAPLVEKVKVAIVANAGTKAALISALNLSNFLTQQKQFKEALDVLDAPKTKPASGELLAGFWNMHRGVVLLENGQVDPAIAAYTAVTSNSSLKSFHPEAFLKLGICYEIKGDLAKARETYEKVGREFPNTEASTSAGQYLRLLDLNSQKQG